MLDAHAHVMQVKLCKANTRGVTRYFTTDRTLVSGGPARLVRRGSENLASVMRPDAGPLTDRTLEGYVRSELT